MSEIVSDPIPITIQDGVYDGPLEVTGLFTSSGGTSTTVDSTIEGKLTIDDTDTEALLVRKDGDSGDILTVDTTNSRVIVTGTIAVNDAAGGSLVDEAASGTNPTLCPNKADVDTGIGSAGSDQLSFITGGTEAIRVNSSGNVGIGTDDPDNKLHVVDTSGNSMVAITGVAHRFEIDDFSGAGGGINLNNMVSGGNLFLGRDMSGGGVIHIGDSSTATGLVIPIAGHANTGNVGIGTDAPSAKLDIYDGSASNIPDGIILQHKKSIASGNEGVALAFKVRPGSNASTVDAAKIVSQMTNNGDSDGRGKLAFYTMGASNAAPTEKMTLDYLGNVGINTSNPDKPLHVAGSIVHSGTHAIYIGNSGTAISFNRDPDDGSIFNSAGCSYQLTRTVHATATSDNLAWQVYNTSGSLVTASALSIDGVGNVGIGTLSPDVRLGQKLDIATSAAQGGLSLSSWSTVTNQAVIMDFKKSLSNTIGTHVTVTDDDDLGHIVFRGSDGAQFRDAAAISAFVDGTVSGGGADDMPGRLVFRTSTDGSSDLVERMRIDAAGITITGNIVPEADGTRSLGTQTTGQWANVWSDLVNGAEISLENKWRIMESDLYGYAPGFAVGHSDRWESGKSIWASDEVGRRKYMEGETPVFAVTDEFLEYKGRRITPEIMDRLLELVETEVSA